ncbi:ferrochelatase [Prosthecochloris sp. ZM_2]|uniref:ferrochelatase n=1 Tax=Prosthecochloris sp. ZM_2 TaxID=2045206 RepID=UPI000DF73CD5|nr:ferrochelatase [Prosthecochloris sp. ZM_2]RNA64832.1 ferrochelatase [Prosthecochloris sp. ZM_2]
MKQHIAVILAAHGEAETAGFFDNFSMNRHTLSHAGEVMNLPVPLQLMISVAGGVKNMVQFRKKNFRSPQNEITRKQAGLLAEKLARQTGETEFDVHTSFFVTPPFVEKVVEETRHYDLQLLIPMAPIDNRLMSGSLELLAERHRPEAGRKRPKVMTGFWNDPDLLDVYRDHLFTHASPSHGTALVLAFHGTLEKDQQGREPGFHTGSREIATMAAALQQAVQNDPRNTYQRVEVAYLNHDVGGTWSSPSLQKMLETLRKDNVDTLELFSCGYFSDGTETLLSAKDHVTESGIKKAGFIPCLNESEAFADYLAAKIHKALTP